MDKQNPSGPIREAASAIQDAIRDPLAAAGEHAANLVGDTVKSAADQVRARIPASGIAGEMADAVTRGAKEATTHLKEEGVGAMIEDVATIARRYPMQMLLLGLGCGYLFFRLRRK